MLYEPRAVYIALTKSERVNAHIVVRLIIVGQRFGVIAGGILCAVDLTVYPHQARNKFYRAKKVEKLRYSLGIVLGTVGICKSEGGSYKS